MTLADLVALNLGVTCALFVSNLILIALFFIREPKP